jgi:hypothetical protein
MTSTSWKSAALASEKAVKEDYPHPIPFRSPAKARTERESDATTTRICAAHRRGRARRHKDQRPHLTNAQKRRHDDTAARRDRRNHHPRRPALRSSECRRRAERQRKHKCGAIAGHEDGSCGWTDATNTSDGNTIRGRIPDSKILYGVAIAPPELWSRLVNADGCVIKRLPSEGQVSCHHHHGCIRPSPVRAVGM